MKLGIITDIHGNVLALKAILPYLRDCDKILCAGDLVDIGPWPQETVELVRSIPNLLAVRGNHENRILSGFTKKDPEEAAHQAWTKARLTEDSLAWLEALPFELHLNFEGRSIYMVHYAPREPGHYRRIVPDPTQADLEDLFPVSDDIVIYGHEHLRNILWTSDRLYCNCGSLGCPGKSRRIARAAILELNDRISLRTLDIPYDVSPALTLLRSPDYPAGAHILKAFYGR